MAEQELRRRCEDLLAGVEIPVPFDIEVFARQFVRHGRPIVLMPSDDLAGVSGLWLATDAADYIAFDAGTTGMHRRQIILHELGHIIAGHSGPDLLNGDASHALLPNLSAEVIRRALARAAYSVTEEQEAEMLATLVLDRIGTQTLPRTAGSVGFLDRTLGGARSG